MKNYLLPLAIVCCFLFNISKNVNAQTGTWTQVATQAPHANNGVCLLMTDGTVICKNTNGPGNGTGWDRLTPDIHGSYVNGTWDTIASMINDRLFFSSQVLPSGKVYVAGGEYGAGGTAGEVYDPVANTWTLCGPIPAGWNIYDGNSQLLYNGNVLEGPQIGSSAISNNILIWSPVTLNYTVGPNSFYSHDEAAWLKMRDSSVLFVGIESDSSNRYIPQTGNWIKDAVVPGFLYDPLGEEAGSAFMLPNGQGIFFGATPYNALYTPTGNTNPGTWTSADSFPVINGTYMGQDDAPGAMMVNGHILLAVSPAPTSSSEFIDPIYFVEYDYTTNTFAQVKSIIPYTGGDSIPNQTCYQAGMLDLPDGTVLVSVDQSSSYSTSYLIYTPGSGPIAQGIPTINSVLPVGCPEYKITGKLFNGISEGSAYGDDWQNSTNYPLIRLSNGTDVYYCKTTNWNRIGAVETDSLEDTAYFEVPNIPGGTYSLVVVANGFASNPVLFSVLGLTSISQTQISCRIDTGSVTVTASGGVSPYTYLWSDSHSQTTATATGLTTGTYTLVLTDNNGCSFSPTVTVTQPPFTISVSTTVLYNATCPNGGADSAFASQGYAPYTYMWNDANSQTGPVATGLSAGVYIVTATDTSGCSATASCTITQTVPINISTSVTSTPGCYGGTGSITATLSGAFFTKTFAYTGYVQNLQIPPGLTTLTVAITGAAGGTSFEGGAGSGASFTAVCPVTPGDVLSLAVGGVGGNSIVDDGEGGGGGTFAYDSNSVTPIAIAGGGGGAGFIGDAGGNGGIMVTNPYSATNGTGGNGANGVGGNGGAAGVATSTDNIVGGGGGTGWFTNGGNGSGRDTSYGGYDEILPGHFAGGRHPKTGSPDSNRGGFGGGGGGGFDGGGGGGGYNGGGGGDDSINGGGGGGGSYLNGTLIGAATAANTGNGFATISYTLPTIGGTSPYTYSWSPSGGTNLTATGLTAGTYTLTVTDNNGCSYTASAVITQPALLSVAVNSATNPLCYGGTGSLSANLIVDTTTSYSKQFSYTGAVQNFTVPASITNVTVTVTGAAGGKSASGGAGPGASFTGICPVIPGHILSFAIGGTGGQTTFDDGDGGGGGSFMYDSNTVTPLAIAGGGGGAGFTGDTGGTGGTIVFSPYSANNGYGGNGANGTGGNGGSYGVYSSFDNVVGGGGGTGWLSNGMGGIGVDTTFGGSDESLPGHFAGGSYPRTGFVDANVGGYGGGGGGGYNGGGGGGGYNGGGGGDDSVDGGGGGGGSYLNGVLVGTPVATNTGNGYATLAYHVPGGTPPYTYSWSPVGGTNLNATGLSAGTYTLTVSDNNGCTATIAATLTQPPALSVTAVTTSTVSCSSSNGIDSAAVSGGTTPYTYLWSDAGSQTTQVATGLAVGTYTITVTDSNGCSASAINILSNSIYVTAAVVTNVNCNGGNNGSASVVTVTGGITPYTYLWNDAGSQATIGATGLAAGIYVITVTDNNGCTGTASADITQPGTLSVSTSGTNVTCPGLTNGSAASTISGGTSPYTYLWSDGGSQTTTNATGLGAGTYTVMASDSCGGSASAAVIISQPPPLLVSASATGSGCSGTSGSATVTGSGGSSPYTYLWSDSNSQTTATATGLSSGTYTVTINDNCGTTGTASVIINVIPPLVVSASGTPSGCNINNGTASVTTSGGTSPYTYSWSDGGGTNANASGLSGGIYSITVTDSCGNPVTASVTITQSIVSITIASRVIQVCDGIGYITAHAATGGASPYTYSWAPSGGTNLETATNLGAGNYTITATDNNGCSGTASESITLPPQLLVTASITSNVSCNGGNNGVVTSVASGGTAPYTYSWFPSGGSNPTEGGLSAGSYRITVTDSNGCAVTAEVIITEPAGMVITHDSIDQNGICDGEAAVTVVSGGVAPYTYSWAGGQTTDTIKGLCAGNYCCTITGNNGCSQTTCIYITNATGIDNVAVGTEQISVYPNPNNGVFTLETAGLSGRSTVEIYNMLGQKIMNEELVKARNIIDLSTEPSGIYLFRVLKSDGSLAGDGKIIIQK